MGFFKRFLSLGSGRRSKKNKQKQKLGAEAVQSQVDAEGRIVHVENRQSDTDANRLLRSTSARWADTLQTESISVPPLPAHHLTAAPPLSPARSATSIQRSNTYIVTVHGRTLHSRTEFPNANPRISRNDSDLNREEPRTPDTDDDRPRLKDVLFTPRDQSCLHALRRDPSVASLLNMYDDRGCLDANAFSNTPPTPAPIQHPQGHEQIKRSGSTLRQLLGDPDQRGEATEGDISWAERFLRERDSPFSSTSSLPLVTPRNVDTHYPDGISKARIFKNPDHSPDQELSQELSFSTQFPVISSMEVEYSGATDTGPERSGTISMPEPSLSAVALGPKTPQRASEVFGFLTERRKSMLGYPATQSLPTLLLSTTTLAAHDHWQPMGNEASPPITVWAASSPRSPDASQEHSSVSHAQVQTATLMKLSTAAASMTNRVRSQSTSRLAIYAAHDTQREDVPESIPPNPDLRQLPEEPCSDEMGVGPSHQTALNRASTRTSIEGGANNIPTSKIPRGPRPRRSQDLSDPSVPSQAKHRQTLDTWVATSDGGSLHNNHSVSAARANSRTSASAPRGPRARDRKIISAANASGKQRRTAGVDVYPRVENGLGLEKHARRKLRTRRSHTLGAEWDDNDKENSAEISPAPSPKAACLKTKVKAQRVSPKTAPTTPLRTGSRAIFDVRYPHGSEGAVAPSPASSSELSPVARDMMANLRKQRLRAREAETRRRFGRTTRAVS